MQFLEPLFVATSKNCPTARCVLPANSVFNDADYFTNPITLLKQILSWNLLHSVTTTTTTAAAVIIIATHNVHST
jgi:hypothetical protein